MGSRGTVPLGDLLDMLNACAPGDQSEEKEHHHWIRYNGRTYASLSRGRHGSGNRAEIQVGQIKQLIRHLEIDGDCAKRQLEILRFSPTANVFLRRRSGPRPPRRRQRFPPAREWTSPPRRGPVPVPPIDAEWQAALRRELGMSRARVRTLAAPLGLFWRLGRPEHAAWYRSERRLRCRA